MKLAPRNNLTLTRRELLRVGGIGIAGGFLNAFRPHNVFAQSAARPLASARKVIFILLDGGLSQVDSFDAKEGKWTPAEFDIRTFKMSGGEHELRMPAGLFKQLPTVLDRVAVVRSLNAWDAVHGRAQYYVQTGHPLNLALAKEVPSIGSVVCHEKAKERRPSDSLPAYVSLNGITSQGGLINQGFLSAEFGPMNLQFTDKIPNLAPPAGSEADFQRRWQFLQEVDGALRGTAGTRGRSLSDYHEYYRSAHAMMSDARLPETFHIDEADRQRYGASTVGNTLILARNLVRADAGTRFVFANFHGWDFHTDIYTPGKRNHLTLCRDLDVAYTNLIKDLAATPTDDDKTKSLLDETLVVCLSEFGRTPGDITPGRVGREHHMFAACGLFAGGGVKGGRVLGATDALGDKVVAPGWAEKRPIYMEDIACTIYSALGIDWRKTVRNTPSGRAFHYVDPASSTTYVDFRPVNELFV